MSKWTLYSQIYKQYSREFKEGYVLELQFYDFDRDVDFTVRQYV